eukprot:CAMPEP_0171194806 /NCGR_PEP_ID=MMETSP0790-20130122/21078_1 /TAXON_ID=2925 /ORGANISM="Alexandrium catenella, Strain OF101" /LENGTH=302 /DNA_ID=CAMNT_0011660013 /DNA_START=37 /DNA_END=945 /DNA_ORIENTATION=+
MAADPESELAECCRELRALAATTASGTPAEAGPVLVLFGRLAALPVSRPLLLASGAGKEVNRAWLRAHPSIAIREQSRRLVRCWRQLIEMQAAGAAAASGASGAEPGADEAGGGGGGSDDEDLMQRPVSELKARLTSLGVGTSRCVEKADLVALLRSAGVPERGPAGAAGAKRRPSLLGASARRTASARLSMGRRSVLRNLHCTKKPQQAGAAMGQKQLEAQLKMVLRAADDFTALGLTRREVETLPSAERAALVRKRWRALTLQAHPDKLPASLKPLAAKAFRRLAAARDGLLRGAAVGGA